MVAKKIAIINFHLAQHLNGKKRKVLKGTQKVLIILKDGGLYLSPNSTDWVLNLMFCPLVYYYGN